MRVIEHFWVSKLTVDWMCWEKTARAWRNWLQLSGEPSHCRDLPGATAACYLADSAPRRVRRLDKMARSTVRIKCEMSAHFASGTRVRRNCRRILVCTVLGVLILSLRTPLYDLNEARQCKALLNFLLNDLFEVGHRSYVSIQTFSSMLNVAPPSVRGISAKQINPKSTQESENSRGGRWKSSVPIRRIPLGQSYKWWLAKAQL